MLITNSGLIDVLILIGTIFISAYLYIKHEYGYWKRKGIPQLKVDPTFPLGNYPKTFPRGISIGAFTKRYYEEFKKAGHKFGGVYLGLRPYLVIIDPVYAKDVLISDFQHFGNRDVYYTEKRYITKNLLSQDGDEWRNARGKLTNLFTSAKMKYFYNTLSKCSKELIENLDSLVKAGAEININEMVACYTTDVISSVIFGIEANSFKEEDAVIRKAGRQLFKEFSKINRIELFLTICYPSLAKKLGVSNIQKQVEDLFHSIVTDTMDYRDKNNIHRSDMLELLIELRKSAVNLTLEEIIAQSFLFYSAGFETSSGVATYTMFELAENQDIQNRLRKEIRTVLAKTDGEITYDSLKEMTYLHQMMNETMRKYPPLTTLTRVCVKDYKFVNTDIKIKKGTPVILPLLGYHYDPKTFPDPQKYDPDRFADKDVKYEGYFPFGDGPRNCIGKRFGTMQVALGLVSILKDFQVFPDPSMQLPIEFDETTFVTNVKQKVKIRLKKIT